MLGTCPFCQRADIEIRDSHIIPRWVHKRIRGDGRAGDQIIVSRTASVQSGEQVSEPMLCADCEQTFGTYDNYASQLAYNRGSAAVLAGCQLRRVPGVNWALGELESAIDVEKISRFAASVFWRGHQAKRLPECDVGDRHAQSIRDYLQGRRRFPPTLTLTLQVFVPDAQGRIEEDQTAWAPVTRLEPGYRDTDFMVCGLLFRLQSGADREGLREFCLLNTTTRTVLLTPSDRHGFLLRIAAAPPKGPGATRLAKPR